MRIANANDSSHSNRETPHTQTENHMTTLTQIAPLLDRLFREAEGLSPFQTPEEAGF